MPPRQISACLTNYVCTCRERVNNLPDLGCRSYRTLARRCRARSSSDVARSDPTAGPPPCSQARAREQYRLGGANGASSGMIWPVGVLRDHIAAPVVRNKHARVPRDCWALAIRDQTNRQRDFTAALRGLFQQKGQMSEGLPASAEVDLNRGVEVHEWSPTIVRTCPLPRGLGRTGRGPTRCYPSLGRSGASLTYRW
jgi:hypothetical protein